MKTKHSPYGIYEGIFKRLIDIVCACLALLLFWWLFILLAIIVRIKVGKPVLFMQERPGKDEKIFKLYKFRSMSNKKDSEGRLLPDDERLTKFGKVLRSTSLDELPELINILKGDMSIVGPRPLLKEYIPYYSNEERHRHDVRPGLTGLAQINGRNAGTWEEKFKYDLAYVNHITFFGDVSIIFRTVLKVIKRSDILVGKEIPAGRLDIVRSQGNGMEGEQNVSI